MTHVNNTLELTLSSQFRYAVKFYIQDVNQYHKSFLTADKYRAELAIRLLGHISIKGITPEIITIIIKQRLETRAEGTVRRDVAYIQRVFSYLRKDLCMRVDDIFKYVRMPSDSARRENIPTEKQVSQIISHLPESCKELAEFLSLTACRRSEALKLRAIDCDVTSRCVKLRDTKNGDDRKIPLSTRAVEIIESRLDRGRTYLWNIRPETITKNFRKAADKVGCRDIVLHSLRHYATTKFFELGLDMVEAASITGHRDPRMLQRYTHLSTKHLANKLG